MTRRDDAHDRLPLPPGNGHACTATHIGADYTDEEREFLAAVDLYKRVRRRPFPTWRELLWLVRAMGYRRPGVSEAGEIADPSCRFLPSSAAGVDAPAPRG